MNLLPWWLAHLIGDFLIQTDWMAARKRTQTIPCLIHASSYCIPFVFCGLLPWQIIVIGIEHFFQDRFGWARIFMKYTNHETFATAPGMTPWSIIVTDNTIHLLFIAIVVAMRGVTL